MSERRRNRETSPRVAAVTESARELGRAAKEAGRDTAEFWRKRWREGDEIGSPDGEAALRLGSTPDGALVCAFSFAGAGKDDLRISFHDDRLEVSAALGRALGRGAEGVEREPVAISCSASADRYDYSRAEAQFKHETLTVLVPPKSSGAVIRVIGDRDSGS
jgi:hypothetical protein